jgi:hypothetical protein
VYQVNKHQQAKQNKGKINPLKKPSQQSVVTRPSPNRLFSELLEEIGSPLITALELAIWTFSPASLRSVFFLSLLGF